MAGTSEASGEKAVGTTQPRRSSWRYIGPGMVVAATGVGAGDLVATLIAGSKFGYTLMWAAVIGCLVKISLAEATGRWHLATGRTIFDGWRSLGSWTTVYFAVYVVIWGFVYGAIMNLWFWPFTGGLASGLEFGPGAPLHENLGRFLAFCLATSLGFDLARAVGTFVLVMVVGGPVMRALRRASRRAAFETPAEFEPERAAVST